MMVIAASRSRKVPKHDFGHFWYVNSPVEIQTNKQNTELRDLHTVTTQWHANHNTSHP